MEGNGFRERGYSWIKVFSGGDKEGGSGGSETIASRPELLQSSTVATSCMRYLKHGWSELRCPGKVQDTQISKTWSGGEESKTTHH